MSRVWLDVGAHLGETTLPRMADDLTIYAFEPNLALAMRSVGRHPRFVVIPMAVAEVDGCTPLYVTVNDACSSTRPLDEAGVAGWQHNDGLRIVQTRYVSSIRLDTFLALAGIEHVDYLKVDAQGADLAVVRSLGERIRDVDRIRLEVQVVRSPYAGAATKDEVMAYLECHGFRLIGADLQSSEQEMNLAFARAA